MDRQINIDEEWAVWPNGTERLYIGPPTDRVRLCLFHIKCPESERGGFVHSIAGIVTRGWTGSCQYCGKRPNQEIFDKIKFLFKSRYEQ